MNKKTEWVGEPIIYSKDTSNPKTGDVIDITGRTNDFKFKKGDVIIHKASGEKAVVAFAYKDLSNIERYHLSFGIGKETDIIKERAETCYELIK